MTILRLEDPLQQAGGAVRLLRDSGAQTEVRAIVSRVPFSEAYNK